MQNRKYNRGQGGDKHRFNNYNIDQDELDFNINSRNSQQQSHQMHNLKHSVVDENDEIQILGTSKNTKSAIVARYSGQNISNFSTDSQIRGAEKIALKKKTVNKFLRRVEKNKKRFVQYQTAKKEAKLKHRLGIPQSDTEKKQLEEYKRQNSQYFNQSQLEYDYEDEEDDQYYGDQDDDDDDDDDAQSQYLDQCNSIHSNGLSHFSVKSAPTPYLAQTPGGPVIRSSERHPNKKFSSNFNSNNNNININHNRKKVGVKPKDFKKKDDFVFFDLFTLYAQNYIGKNKKKQQQMKNLNSRSQEVIEQDDLQLQSQIFE